jgi:glycosyltransferase involved in cell wall biosynthesis
MPDLVSIVFSFRNEEDVLPELIRRSLTAFDGEDEDVELIFVNDDSTDRSLEILKAAHADDPRIKVVTMSRRVVPRMATWSSTSRPMTKTEGSASISCSTASRTASA